MTSEGRDPEALLIRMTRRERVLMDQVESLASMIGKKQEDCEIVTLDIESNGLKHSTYPLEIAYASGSSSEPTSVYSTLIKPRPDWDISQLRNATHIHGITPEMLEDAPYADTICDHLDNALKGKIVVVDGGQYDAYWMSRLYDGRAPQFTLGGINSKHQETINELRKKSTVSHRALPDAIWLYRALRIAIRKEEEK